VSSWFAGVTERGHYAGRGFRTRQGTYVLTPRGDLLASIPPACADSVLDMMRRALEAWEDVPEERRHPAPCFGDARSWEEDCPDADGLVLELVVRDLGAASGDARSAPRSAARARSADLDRRLNFDHVWFSKGEALQWVPDQLDVGCGRALPAGLVGRLVRLHLLDSVTGALPKRFEPRQVGPSWIRTEVVGRDGSRVHLRIRGETRADASGRELRLAANRVETRVLGYATFDSATMTFERFEAVALGRCEEFLLRGGEPSREPREIGFVLRLAAPGHPKTPPLFLHRYDVEWVEARAIHEETLTAAAHRRP